MTERKGLQHKDGKKCYLYAHNDKYKGTWEKTLPQNYPLFTSTIPSYTFQYICTYPFLFIHPFLTQGMKGIYNMKETFFQGPPRKTAYIPATNSLLYVSFHITLKGWSQQKQTLCPHQYTIELLCMCSLLDCTIQYSRLFILSITNSLLAIHCSLLFSGEWRVFFALYI